MAAVAIVYQTFKSGDKVRVINEKLLRDVPNINSVGVVQGVCVSDKERYTVVFPKNKTPYNMYPEDLKLECETKPKETEVIPNGPTVNEYFSALADLEEKEDEIACLNEAFDSLEEENGDLKDHITAQDAKIADLEAKLAELTAFNNMLRSEKEARAFSASATQFTPGKK